MTESLQEKAIFYLEYFEELAKNYTPTVIDAALAVTRINGIQNIIYGVIGAIIYSLLIFLSFKVYKLYKKTLDENTLFLIIPIFIVSIINIPHFLYLIDVWNWAAIFSPKLYIAYELWEKIK